MKVKTLFLRTGLCCFLLCLGEALRAQYGAELTIGAKINYVGGGHIVNSDGKIVNLGYTIKGVLSPGYFVYNHIALGANLGYEYMTNDDGHQYTLEAIPFIRYYTHHGDVRFFLQLESGYGWGESYLKKGHDGRHSLWVSTLKPGIWIRMKDYMAVEVSLMSLEYKKVNMKDKSSGNRLNFEKWRYNWLDVSFGVTFVIGL